ncbi:hypothetical protein [Natronorubrum sp. DTA7]|uniref:hypothetical protein n=1 Tax=Natronorubrum sp. DTA7 TaxID=3447016 RepID=UPI003F8436AE
MAVINRVDDRVDSAARSRNGGDVVGFALVTAVWSLLFPFGTTLGLLFAGVTVVYCFRRLADR